MRLRDWLCSSLSRRAQALELEDEALALWLTARDGLVNIGIIVCLCHIVEVWQGSEFYFDNAAVGSLLTKRMFAPSNTSSPEEERQIGLLLPDYSGIATIPMVWDWLHACILPAFATPAPRVLVSNRLLGAVRLRQVRVRSGTCSMREVFDSVFAECYGPYTYDNENKGSFGSSSGPTATAWEWSSPQSLGGGYFYGEVETYGGGGFYADLPKDHDKVGRALPPPQLARGSVLALTHAPALPRMAGRRAAGRAPRRALARRGDPHAVRRHQPLQPGPERVRARQPVHRDPPHRRPAPQGVGEHTQTAPGRALPGDVTGAAAGVVAMDRVDAGRRARRVRVVGLRDRHCARHALDGHRRRRRRQHHGHREKLPLPGPGLGPRPGGPALRRVRGPADGALQLRRVPLRGDPAAVPVLRPLAVPQRLWTPLQAHLHAVPLAAQHGVVLLHVRHPHVLVQHAGLPRVRHRPLRLPHLSELSVRPH
ncbi:uncharacterized protein LOC113203766 isoform X1 [Frankliniella occidentalis]|uniref:Uncharacterized protein LOC113203766 isoform X1 n=1 Tax=Frankliniella occidentalis TaxID=133901 RepID=A0A9C6X3N1_FRAOC|nr:uncharacterized protein LOC113203766 isoform X1 [Frankliniella occidentalis]